MADFSHYFPKRDEAAILDEMMQRIDTSDLDEIMDREARRLASVVHPAILAPWLDASRSHDRAAWRFMETLLCTVRSRTPTNGIPAVLLEWALDVATGEITKPPDKRPGRPSELARDVVIIDAVKALHDHAGLPYESRDRRSACHAVAERVHLAYSTVRGIWERHP